MKILKKGLNAITDETIAKVVGFLFLAGVVVAGVVLNGKIGSTTMVNAMSTLLNETKGLRTSTGYGTGNLTPALIRSKAIQKGLKIDGDNLYNPTNGPVTITGAGMTFTLATSKVKDEDCMKLATTLSGADIESMKINSGSEVTSEMSQIDAANQCNAGKENTISITSY